MVPYSTCEVDGWSVVQVMVAVVAVTPLEATLLIAGAATGVMKIKFADATVPAEFADRTAKS